MLHDQDLPVLAEAVLAGRQRLLMWGVYDAAALAERQIMLPVSGYIDTERAGTLYRGRTVMAPDALEGMDPAATVVMFNYYFIRSFPDFAARLDRLGLRYFAPTPLALACGHDDPDLAPDRLLPSRPPLDRWARLAEGLSRHRVGASNADGRGIVLTLVSLQVGGAERQMATLAAELARRGEPATLVTLHPPPAEAAHYRRDLMAAGVDLVMATAAVTDEREGWFERLRAEAPEVAGLLGLLPPHMAWSVFLLYREYNRIRPKAVICYLDQPNVLGGLAAILAGVPHVLLSGRNLNPTHFPHFFGGQCPEMRRVYQALLSCAGVGMSANSAPAALSYAQWLELPSEAVSVIANAVAPWALEHGPRPVRTGPPVVLGLFRLSAEKRPLDFVETIARLRPAFPDLTAVICGEGALRGEVEARIAALGLNTVIEMAGAVGDVASRLAGADMVLHTSEAEGMPNVLLEAQAMGVPVLTTASAGSLAALSPSLAELCVAVGDVAGLANSASRLLADRAWATGLGMAASAFVRERFSMDRLVEATLAALGPIR